MHSHSSYKYSLNYKWEPPMKIPKRLKKVMEEGWGEDEMTSKPSNMGTKLPI